MSLVISTPRRAAPALRQRVRHDASGDHFLRDLTVLLFAVTGGLTLSGIIANIYRMLAPQTRRAAARPSLYYAVMAFAGASVLLETPRAPSARRTARRRPMASPWRSSAIGALSWVSAS